MNRTFRLLFVFLLMGAVLYPVQAQETKKSTDKSDEKVEKKSGGEKAKKAKKAKKKAQSKEDDKPKFLRIRRKKGELVAMQTAVVTYQSVGEKNKGVTVDLIGVVHVGEANYYKKLNKMFKSYDALLYELVAPEGTKIPKGGRKRGGGGAIGGIQTGLKDMLGLQFQLDHIDYTKKNFVHADMSPKEFDKSMKDRGESWISMFFRMMGQGMAMQAKKGGGGTNDIQLLIALATGNKFQMKRIMAEQFEDMEATMSAFNGPKGSTIITERNRKAFDVLQREIKAGKKNLGVFYGAGHLPDMEERLLKEFGMKRVSEKWLNAWDLKEKTKSE